MAKTLVEYNEKRYCTVTEAIIESFFSEGCRLLVYSTNGFNTPPLEAELLILQSNRHSETSSNLS